MQIWIHCGLTRGDRMKVLMVAHYKYNAKDSDKKLTGLATFLDALIREEGSLLQVGFWCLSDVMQNVSKKADILKLVFASVLRIKGFFLKNIVYMVRTFGLHDALIHCVFLGELEKRIREEAPDMIHFHGISDLILLLNKYCDYAGQKYLFTIHLYVRTNIGSRREKLIFCNSPCKWISVVSSGMKHRMIQDHPQYDANRILVVTNGTDYERQSSSFDIHETHKIEREQRVLLCIGTLCNRKNQVQLIRVFALLPPEIRDKITILFMGSDVLNGRFQELVKESGLEDKLLYIGGVDQEQMHSYYNQADGVITASRFEGFSMVFLEAMVYGLPLILPFGLDSNDDMKDDHVSCIAGDTTDEAFVQAVTRWYYGSWDREYIRSYAENFRMHQVAENYKRVYEEICFH